MILGVQERCDSSRVWALLMGRETVYMNRVIVLLWWSAVLGYSQTARAESEPVRQVWMQQHHELKADIQACQAGKRLASPHLLDPQAAVYKEDRLVCDIVLRRTAALLKSLQALPNRDDLKDFKEEWTGLKKRCNKSRSDRYALYLEICRLRRKIALSNPLLDFDEMIFVTKSGTEEDVLQCWNYGYAVDSGGGLFKVSGFKQETPRIENILKDAVVESGRLKGTKLTTRGAFNIPALDYDGETIAFSYVESSCVEEMGSEPRWPRDVFEGFTKETCFHLFRVNADGSELVQLSDGRRNDYHPCFLPNGRIVFVSDRRNVMDRCQGGNPFRSGSQPCGTMHSIKADGSDLIGISYHETSELLPSVDNNGMLVYTRWDYVDRDFCAAHHFWICYPDGRNPRAPHGNYPFPHHTFYGQWKDGRADRPWAEYGIKSIPGSHRYMAVAGKHHIAGPSGTLVLVDTGIEDDNKMSQVTLFHNYELMDEAEDYHGDMDEGLPESPLYTDPWPLSEEYLIAAQGNKVFLLDAFGNQELLFWASDSACAGIGSIRCPIPLKARRRPPILPTMTNQGVRYGTPDHRRATVAVMDVYESDFVWPPHTRITGLRVLQLFPYPWHSPWEDKPRVGPGNGVNARGVLGVVPVEEDGSAYFEAPVEKAIYFQALDQNGMAVQSMRSATYVHPGEQLTCLGCHEETEEAPEPEKMPMALKRPPSKLIPNLEDGSFPINYARLVEPLLVNKCNACHVKSNRPKPDLQKYQFYFHGTNGHSGVEPVHGGYRTIAGKFGAIASGLAEVMLQKQHREALTLEEINRITLWADTNSNQLGAYRDVAKQEAGEIVWPVMDVDPLNPAGIDLFKGCSAPPTPSASTPQMKRSEEIIKTRWPDL